MRGSVKKRGNSYSVVFDIGRDPKTGKRIQRRISGIATKKAAEAELAKVIAEVERGTYIDPAKATVAEWLREWLKNHCSKGLSPSTVRGYRMIVETLLIPALGSVLLCKLLPVHIQSYYQSGLEAGRKDGKKANGGALSARTINQHHRVLNNALGTAANMRLIHWNPCSVVDPPKGERRVPNTLSSDEVPRVLEAVRGTYLYIPSLLAISTGARRGEVLGLRWRDVDLNKGLVTIKQELLRVNKESIFHHPKTPGSVRPIPKLCMAE